MCPIPSGYGNDGSMWGQTVISVCSLIRGQNTCHEVRDLGSNPGMTLIIK